MVFSSTKALVQIALPTRPIIAAETNDCESRQKGIAFIVPVRQIIAMCSIWLV